MVVGLGVFGIDLQCLLERSHGFFLLSLLPIDIGNIEMASSIIGFDIDGLLIFREGILHLPFFKVNIS